MKQVLYLVIIHHREGVLMSGYDMVTVLALIWKERKKHWSLLWKEQVYLARYAVTIL